MRSRCAFILAVLVLASSLAVPLLGNAQAPSFQVRSVGVQAPPLVLGVQNVLVAVLANDGSNPISPVPEFRVTDGAGTQRTLAVDGGSPLLGGQQRTYTANWDGRTTTGDDFQSGPVTVRFTVRDTLTGGTAERSATATLESHELDLQVSDRSAETMPPGQAWGHLTATVTNAGSVALPANLALDAPAGLDGWTYSFRPDAVVTQLAFAGADALAPGAAQQALIFITAPYTAEPGTPDDQGPGRLTARAGAADPVASADLRPLSPHVVAGGQVAFLVNAAPVPVLPGAQAVAQVTVRNDQNRDEIGTLRLTAPSGAAGQVAAIDPPGAIGLAAGEEQTYTVTFTVPGVQGGAGALAGVYDWTATFASEVGARATTTFSTPVRLTVAPVRAVQATVEDVLPEPVAPGERLEATVRVCNQGNVPARYGLSATVLVGATSHSWAADPSSTASAVAPGACQSSGTASFPSWGAVVPDGFAAGAANLRVVATDLQDANVRSEPAFHAFPVAAVALPSLTVTQDTQPIDAGQARTFAVRLTNRGNAAGTFTLASSTLSAEPVAGWSVAAPSGTSHTLAALETTDLAYTITAPGGTQAPGDRLQLRVTATTGGRTHDVTVQAVAPFPDLRVCPLGPLGAQGCPTTPLSTTPATLFRGYGGVVDLVVANLGGRATTQPVALDVVFSDEAGLELATRQVTVAPLPFQGAERSRIVQVAAPTATYNGVLRVRATIDGLHEAAEGQEDNNRLDATVRVEVFGIRVVKPTDLVVHPGEKLSFSGPTSFYVENLGTRGHDVIAAFRLDPAWTSLQPTSLVGIGAQQGNGLAKGTTAPVTTSFDVPLAPLANAANLTLRVEHAAFPSIAVEERVRLRIDDTDAPVLGALQADRTSLPLDTQAVVRARATDATGIKEARTYVVEPTGAVRWVAMAPEGNDTFRAAIAFTLTGQHQLHFWAKDGSSTPNVADGSRAPLSINVLAVTGPRLQLVVPSDGAIVRPGTPIVLNAHSLASLQSVQATLDGVASALPAVNPIQVPTDGLADGPLALSVTVRDALGQNMTLTAGFTLDGTVPQVRAIEVVQSRRAGGNVTFRAEVQDASPLRSVVLRLQAADGRVVEHAMQADETGYAVSLADAGAALSAQVIAEDVAGNRGFAERDLARAPSAGKDSPLPVAVLQSALLLALALWRRRA